MLLFALVPFLPGCAEQDQEPRSSAAFAAIFADKTAHAIDVGGGSDTSGVTVFSAIVSARLMARGEHRVVLDHFPPFVRVFDAHGKLVSAFVERGGGPREAVHPYAIATMGDSLILLVHDSRISLFGLHGAVIAEASNLKFLPVAATEGCHGDWVFYGPRLSRTDSAVAWLHSVNIDAEGARDGEYLYADQARPGTVRFGSFRGLVSDSGAIYLYHDDGNPQTILEWLCSRSVAVVLDTVPGDSRSPMRSSKAGAVGFVAADELFPVGIAPTGSGVVWARMRYEAPGVPGRTYLNFVRPRSERETISIAGSYRIQDSKPDIGVLVNAQDPVPHVFLVPWSDWITAVRETFAR